VRRRGVNLREFATVRDVHIMTGEIYSNGLLSRYSLDHDIPEAKATYDRGNSLPAFHKDAWMGLYGVKV
jgi:hypothetical protein